MLKSKKYAISKLLSFVMFFVFTCSLRGQITVKLTHNNCPGDKNGSILMNIDNSVLDDYPLPYNCEWENLTNGDYEEFVINASSHLLSNLESGDYEVTIYLDSECEIDLDETIIDQKAVYVGGIVDCNTISVNPSSQSFGDIFLFEWSTGYKDEGFSSKLTNLSRGIYCVTVSSVLSPSCVEEECFEVLDIPEIVVDPDLTPSYENCSTGRINLNVTGGTPPYIYKWSNGKTSQDILNLAPGNYTVSITDDLCGTLEATYEVPSKGDYFHVSTDVIQPCNNDNGTITVTPSAASPNGCQPAFTYQWSHDPSNLTSMAEDLAEGDYSVTITGPIYSGVGCPLAVPCTVVKNFKLEPKRLIDEIVVDNICMQGEGNGSLTANLTTDATYPFTYMWSNGKPKKTIQDLDEGLYVVTITDKRGCTEVAKAEITSQFDLTTKIINPSGCSGADGSISLQPISTNADCGFYFSYQWDYMDKTTASIDELAEGTYIVTITTTPGSLACGNIQGCSVVKEFTLSAKDGLTAAVKKYENFEDCEFNGGKLFEIPFIGGNIDVDIVGGVEPYSFQWMFNGELFSTSQNIKGEKYLLGPGLYTFVVTDAKGCTDEIEVELCCCSYESFNGAPNQSLLCGTATPPSDPSYVNFTLGKELKSATTATSNDGEITVLVNWTKIFPNNSAPELHYYWTKDGDFFSDKKKITGLAPGTYRVLVTSGCISKSMTVVILDCAKISANMVISGDVKNYPCLGYDVGTISISNVSGGTSPYTYRWNTGGESSYIDHLSLGTYTVTVTDAGGCGSSESFSIENLLPVSRIGCEVFCGGLEGVRVESFFPTSKVYDELNCLHGSVNCSDGVFLKPFSDDARYQYYENFNECGVKFTCPGTGELIKEVKGELIDDSDFTGEKLSFTNFLFGSVGESLLSNSNIISLISDAKPNLYCGDFTGCKFSSFSEEVYYEKMYTPSNDWYPFDVDKYPFALAFAGEGVVKDGWHFIRSMEYCYHEGDGCPVTTDDMGIDNRCCLALFCKGEIIGIGDCKNCNQVRPAEIVLDDIESRSAIIDVTSEFEVALAPNPLLDNKIRLSFGAKDLQGVNIKIFGILHGKALMSGFYLLDKQKVDLTIPFLPGIYFLVVADEKGNQVIKKLVKQ